MDVTPNEANPAGAPNPAGTPQPWWPGTTYSQTLVVACVDVAATKDLAAFKAAYAAPNAGGATPRQYDAVGVRARFANELAADLAEGGVALGFEAPLWGLADQPLGPFRPRTLNQGAARASFEADATAWYGQAGAQAAAKVLHLVKGILDGLKPLVNGLEVTFGGSAAWGVGGPPFTGRKGQLLIWEAFVTGAPPSGYKPPSAVGLPLGRPAPRNANVRDAYFAVEYGFANTPPLPNPVPPAITVMPIAGAAIETAGVAVGPTPWWNTPCLVIGPRDPKPGSADLLWP